MIFLSGDPAVLMLPPEATAEEVASFRHAYGFDDPLLVQYARFLGNALRLDFGRSIRYDEPALGLVLERLPATLQLSIFSVVLAVVIAIPLGMIAALRRNSPIDHAASTLAILGQSMPNYWLGFLLVYAISVKLHLLPTSGGPGLRYVILPGLTIAFALLALITRMTRSSMLEVLGQDYMRTARAKGIRESAVIIRHGLRNALLPVVTLVALQFGYILGGAVVIETIFAWPGLGLLTIQAIYNRDYPLVQAAVLFLATSFVLINLATDISYQYLDPRLRRSNHG
ncbi:MAG: ABC transporter permease [Anaerolineae bacterium]|nr:ABC transporter permease [Anaerolineae bacterium]